MPRSERFNKKRVAYATPFHSRVRRAAMAMTHLWSAI